MAAGTAMAMVMALAMLIVLATGMAMAQVQGQQVSFSITNFSASAAELLVQGQTLVNASDGALDLTYNSSGATGPYFISRVLHSTAIPLYDLSRGLASSFNTSFTFAIAAMDNDTAVTGDGFAFLIVPDTQMPTGQAASAGSLGLYDANIYGAGSTNASELHLVAVEYDTFVNVDDHDPDDHHVGLDINSLTSVATGSLPPDLTLKSTNLTRRLVTWIDYDAPSQQLDVYLALSPAPHGKASATKVLSHSPLRLWDTALPSSYVGFSASTGLFQERNSIYAWNFSSRMVSIPVPPPPPPSPASSSRTKLIIGLTIGLACLLLIIAALLLYIKKSLTPTGLHLDADLMTAPRKFTYKELSLATCDFSEILGHGGSGQVYKGLITTSNFGAEHVAVKKISKTSKHGQKEFKSEILTIGRIRHRNLVHLYGWCSEKGELMLVYQFMPNGSLDKLLYPTNDSDVLSWSMRFSILKGVASALVYLHVDWEKRIIHRDIKASNVMLDSNLNARLGDFGLARFFDHDQYVTESLATGVAGTWGYMAPEYAMSGRVTMESDMYSFGVLALEIACGRRPLPSPTAQESLVDCVWRKHEEGNLLDLADKRLQGDLDGDELRCVICTGLLCTHPDPMSRLTAAQVLQILRGDMEFPEMPVSRPMAIYVQVPTTRVHGTGVLTTMPASYPSDALTSEGTMTMELSGPR